MKLKRIVFISVIVAIFVMYILTINFPQKINTNYLWTLYDQNINNIEKNMSQITYSSDSFEWEELNELKTNDKDYKDFLNYLAKDIRTCYIGFTDNGKYYTDSNSIRAFRSKKYISKKNVSILNSTLGNCLNAFKGLAGYSKADEKFNYEIDKIIKFESDISSNNKYLTYDEMLIQKNIEVSIVSDISDWLYNEYNNLNK